MKLQSRPPIPISPKNKNVKGQGLTPFSLFALAQVPQLGRWIRRKMPGHFCAKFLDHTTAGMLSKFCVELSSAFCASVLRAQLRNLGLVALYALSAFPLWAGCGAGEGGGATPGAPTLTNIWASTATVTVPIGSNTNDLCFYVIRATWSLDGSTYERYVQSSGLLGASTAYLQDVGADTNFPKVVSGLNPGTTLYISAAAADDSTGTDLTPYSVSTSTVTRPGMAVAPGTQTNTWQSDSRFYFRPFFNGAPIADNYQFKWDQSSTAWDGTSQDGATASAANSTRTATAVGDWYFHSRFRNTAGTVLSYQDLGPFKFDNVLPVISNAECRQRDQTTFTACSNAINISTPTIRHDVQDSNSGIVIGEQSLGISSGTVLYLDFEEWPPLDKSGYSVAIELGGATQNTSGRFGSAAELDAASEYIKISTIPALVGETKASVEMWFFKKQDYATALRMLYMFSNSNSGEATGGLFTTLDFSGSVGQGAILFTNGDRQIELAAPRDQFDSRASAGWNYLVTTWDDDNNQAIIYLNGKEITRKTVAAATNFNFNLLVGRAAADTYRGLVDELRVSRRLLSPEDVAANFFSGARKFTRDGGTNWVIDPSTYTATGAVSTTGSTGDTVARKATGVVNFDNAHATNNQFLYLIRDRAGNVATTTTTVNIPYASASFSSVQAEPKDGQGFTATESGGSITVNDITPNIRFTAQAQGPAPLRVSSTTISISSDTVLYLDFEEWPSLDKSGYGHHPNQIAGNAAQAASGMREKGLSLDGTGDYLVVPRTPALTVNTGDFTAVAWFKPTALGERHALLSSEAAALDCGWLAWFESTNILFTRRSASDFNTGYTLPSANAWYMFAFVYSGSNVSVYVNGEFKSSGGSQAADSSCDNAFYVGRFAADANYDANGTFDEVKLVKRAMAAEEIRLEYNASHLEVSRDAGSTWMTTNTWTNNNLEISGSPRTSFGANVLTSTQTAFFQEHATNNQIRFKVMDAIGNITTSSAYTVNIAAANPAISNDQIADSQGSFSSGIASQWSNTLSPKTRFTSVQDTGSGLASRTIDNRTILYFPFDEGSGTTVTDLSSNTAAGTLKAYPSGVLLPTWTSGVFGSGLNFANGFVEVSTISALNSVSAITFQMWVKTLQSATNVYILGKDGGGAGGFDVVLNTTGGCEGGVGGGVGVPALFTRGGNYLCALTPINDNQWHLLTITNDGTTTKFYIDNRLDRSAAHGLSANSTRVLEINRERGANGAVLNGSLDEVQIYNYARSAEDIAADWRRGINRIHQVEVSTNSGTNYYTMEVASVTIDGVDGSLAVQTLTADMAPTICPPGWTSYPGSRSCYKWFSADSTGWAQGRDVCIAEGGDLVRVDSTQENDFILRSGSYGSSTPFLGINDQTLEGTYAWADGSAVTYTNWKSGQPVNNAATDCVVFEAFSTGTWSTDACTAQRSPICEKPAVPFAEGSNNRLRVNVYDQSGRVGQSTYTVNVDITAPLPPTLAMSEPLGWPRISTMPIAMASQGTVVWNKRLYVMGGLDTSNTLLDRVFYASINNDGSLGAWTEETTNKLPGPRYSMGAVAYGGRIYVVGGYSALNTHSQTVWYAPVNSNGSLGAWVVSSNFPVSAGDASADILNGYLYASGGYTTSGSTTAYTAKINSNGSLDSWKPTGYPIPQTSASCEGFKLIAYRDTLYAFGLNNCGANDVFYAKVIDSEGRLGSWTLLLNSLPTAAAAREYVLFNNRFLSLGGVGVESTIYSSVLDSAGALGAWNAFSVSLSTGRYSARAVAYGNKVYLVGGAAAAGTRPYQPTVLMGDFSFTGVSSPANGQLSVSFSAAAADKSGGSGLHATPSRVEISTSSDCSGTATYDSGYSAATSFTGTSLSTSTPYFVRALARDTALNSQSNSCVGPFYPQDNSAPLPPILSEVTFSTWTQTTSIPAVRYQHSSVIFNNRAYVIGGQDASTARAEAYFASINADGTLGSWTQATSLPAARFFHSSFVSNNRVYVVGGHDGSAYRSEVFFAIINADGTLGSWTQTASLPAVRRQHSSVVFNSRAYVIGGQEAGIVRSEVYSAPINTDGTLGSWTQTTSLPVVRYDHSSSIFNNRVYAIGGFDGAAVRSEIYSAPINADGTLGSWTQTTSLPSVRYAHSSSILNNRVYTIGGSDAAVGRAEVYRASINSDGTLAAWSQMTSLPASRYYSPSVIFNNRIYTFAGHDGSAVRAEVFVASVSISGISSAQAGDLSISFSASSDAFSSLDASPHWVEVSTNSYCEPTFSNSGWFSGTSKTLTLSGGTSYYARLRGRDATGLASEFNGCYGPTYVSRTIFVTVSSVTSPTTVAQGSKGALMKLDIYTQSSTSSWTTLNLAKLGTLTDAEVKGVGVCVDNGDGSFDSTSDPCPFDFQKFTGGIATVTLSGTQADLNTSTKTYFVVAEPDSLALPTNTVGVSITGAGSFSFSTDHRSNVNAPFNSRLLTVSDGASQVTVTPTSLAPTTIAKGRTNTAFLKMRVEVNQGTAELKEFLLRSSGTAVASDVSVVKVYRDDGDGSFSAAGDTLLGPSTSTFTLGYSTYAFTASQSNKTIRSGTPAQLFLVFDVAQGAQTSNTLGIALDATSYFRLQGSSDAVVTTNFPMTSSPLSIISEPHNLYDLWTNKASTSVFQGATQAMGKLQLWTDKAVATVNSLRVELKTGEFDSAVTRVYFYQDSGSGEFESSADTQLSSGTFSGRISNLSFTSQSIDTSTRTYFVVYEVNPTAIQDQTVTLNVASGYLGITTSDSVEALNPSPFISTSSKISPTTDTMLLSKASALSKLSVDQGKTNFLVANLKTVMGSGGGVWTGLKVTKQGSTPDSDFDRVSLWKDNDSDRVFTSTGDVAIGFQENTQSGVFVNRQITVDFTESQNLDTTTRYYYITTSVDANAVVGSTFSFIVVSTSDIKMSAPDLALSVNLPLISDAIDVTQFQNTVVANFISSAPATVAVADRGVLIGKLRFYSDLNNVSFSSLRLDRLGTTSDSDVARVYLREDTNGSGSFEEISDTIISSGTFTDGTLQFTSLGKTILSGSASSGGSSFFVTVDVSSAATPERTFQIRLLDKNYVGVTFPNQVSSTTFPLNAGSVTIKPPPVTVYSVPESLAAASALKGTTDVPIARVRLWSNWFSAQLSKVRVNLIGTAEDADIARVKIIYDLNGNGTCCQGDSLVTSGSDAFTKGVAEISFASAQTITTSTKTYFVLFDLSSQASQKTAGIGINAGNYFGLDSPNTLSETNLPFASGLVTITPTVAGLVITPGDLAPTFVTQASTNVLFSRLALQTTAYSLSLQGLTLNKIGTLDDAEISNVRVWLDANKDNVVGSTETALTSGTRQFANSKIALLFTSPVTIDTSGSQILVALDISRAASLNATVGVRLAQAGDVTVDSPNFAVPIGYPMSSSTSPVRDLGDTVSMSLTDISNREIGQGKTNQPVVKLQASTNEDSATLTEIRVDKTGDLADSHISLLKIFRDNGNAEWDGSTTETLVATTAISGAIGRLSLSETLTTSTKTYFVAVDISSQATVAAKFGLNIAGNLYVKAASPDTVKDFSNFLTADISIRDLKTPAIPAVADGGKYTYLATKLTATFSSSVEEGTITECEYGVGTTTATPSLRDWTSAGTQTSVDIAGLSLSPGTTYYVLTRCKTNLGFTSTIGFSDGILVDSVKPTFSAAPAVQAEGQNVVCSWTKPSHGESGVTLYKVEERRADTPVWNPVVNVSTSGARALGGYSVMAQPAQSGGGVITSSQLQVVIQNKTSGTYYYRVLAESGAGQWSDASGETRVVLGIGSQSEVIANLRAYPNPVDTRKKSATIYYDLNQNSDVEIKIFDLFGKEVITLNFSSGSEGGKQGGNSVSWNGESEKGEKVSFGAYLLRVRAKSTGDVKKYKLGVIH